VKLLAFSDLHCDLEQAAALVRKSAEADVVAGVGDFASVHRGLEETIAALAAIDKPTLLVPGNNETEQELRDAAAGWAQATVLHAQATTLEGVEFFGLGGGIPVTPWDWSFDIEEGEAAKLLEELQVGGVLLVHSPPYGHADQSSAGQHLGSRSILAAIEDHSPRLALCGHIHDSWGEESLIGPARVINLGPGGRLLDLD
jgi:Icc-related predicted phosphoesterase